MHNVSHTALRSTHNPYASIFGKYSNHLHHLVTNTTTTSPNNANGKQYIAQKFSLPSFIATKASPLSTTDRSSTPSSQATSISDKEAQANGIQLAQRSRRKCVLLSLLALVIVL